MNQMQALLEKARNDKELMAKLDALGVSGAGPDKIVALAAEHGFAITEEDYRKVSAQAGTRKAGELKEEDLEAVAGGFVTENRYDPKVCNQYKEVGYECVGFLHLILCDHYRSETLQNDFGNHTGWRYTCRMGRYDYIKPNPDA